MVALVFNLYGYAFQEGARILRASFNAAEAAMIDELERAKAEAFGHQQSIDEGAEWVGAMDEDGHVLWDQQVLLDFRVTDAETAAQEFRKAFAITLFHHWERAAQRWSGKRELSHTGLLADAIAQGYPVHYQLEQLRCLANALKHDKVSWASKLLPGRADLFTPGYNPATSKISPYEAVHLRASNVEAFLDIVSASGPDYNTASLRPVK